MNGVCIARLDGNLVWVKRAGGIYGDQGRDLAVDNSGNVYITGYIRNTATFGPGEAGEIMLSYVFDRTPFHFVAKYSASGNPIWAKASRSPSGSYGESIAVDDSGNAYVTGYFIGHSAGFGTGKAGATSLGGGSPNSTFVTKYATSKGNLIFAKLAARNGRGRGIALNDSGNFSVTGFYSSSVTFKRGVISEITLASDGFRNIFVAKNSPVSSATSPVIAETRVTASSDDAEEDTSTGMVKPGSSDLELGHQNQKNQLVGIRFTGLNIPQGATITNASIQFQTDETHSGATSLIIEGEATDNTLTFTNTNANISSRALTGATIDWVPAPWTTEGEAGVAQQSPNIASIIQEIVERPGWSSGNALVVIISGSGRRNAESFNGDPSGAPVLHVEYQ